MATQMEKDIKRIEDSAKRLKEVAKAKGNDLFGRMLTHTANLIENIEKAVAPTPIKDKKGSASSKK
jgi:hypothetical protein